MGEVLSAREAYALSLDERGRFVEFDKAGRMFLPSDCQVEGSGVLLPPAAPLEEDDSGDSDVGKLVSAFNEAPGDPSGDGRPTWR